MNRRILIVDDDEDILELLQYNLEKDGYDVKTIRQSERALPTALKFKPDLIILDILMPGENGIALCRKLRTHHFFRTTYIFFLTAHAESYYQQAAFHTGGDDYIEKIIGLKALTRKITAVLKNDYVIRKSKMEFSVGDLELSRKTLSVDFRGKSVQLTPVEFELLFFFAQNSSRIIPLSQLIQTIWGSDTFAESHLEVHIQNLHRKLGVPLIAEKRKDLFYLKPDKY